MVREENDCVGCAIPCIDCGLQRAKHYYCDACGKECSPDELKPVNQIEVAYICRICRYKMEEEEYV
ncbi:MAG: hypothetical protein K2H01_04745 [Ruminococcus sp.]|nr:hypothetical protein [Ruminococcus sp.]